MAWTLTAEIVHQSFPGVRILVQLLNFRPAIGAGVPHAGFDLFCAQLAVPVEADSNIVLA